MRRFGDRGIRSAAAAAFAVVLVPALVSAGDAGSRGSRPAELAGAFTGPRAELRETVPIARRAAERARSVLSLPLGTLERGHRVRFNGEVTVTTTCVERLQRCIGTPYEFDPKLRAQVVLAARPRQVGSTDPVSRRVGLECEQTRPNRNHHCPLVVGGSFTLSRAQARACARTECRLNMILDAHHKKAEGGEVVVVGADRPDGSVEGGKARLSAALIRAGAQVDRSRRKTTKRRARKLPASGAQRVVYSRRLGGLRSGDVLLARGKQLTSIRRLPYFVASKVVLTTRPDARRPSRLSKRLTTRAGTLTETNGFNCTPGPSAFTSPCTTRKLGLAVIKKTPRYPNGRSRPLYANLVSRAFPKLAQARGSYPPARVRHGGELLVTRLRARP